MSALASASSGSSLSGSSSSGSASYSSGSSSSGSSLAADSSTASAVASEISGSSSGSGGSSGSSSSSLFGNSYDLSDAESALELTATDSDEAEEVLEELYEVLDDVQLQYEELMRIRTSTALEIQYNYDTTMLAAELAEITYQQTVESLEDELQSYEDALTDLEDALAVLQSLEDGTVTAEAAGTLSAVNYSAGDTLSSATALYSIYDTDVVTITIEVTQYDIAKMAVGDTVSVVLSGYGTVDGTISEKDTEPQDGTSRTKVIYNVEISVDNSLGWLSAGIGATITVPVEDAGTESSGQNQTEDTQTEASDEIAEERMTTENFDEAADDHEEQSEETEGTESKLTE
ncbi:MAG: HlyD family secretion protein [Lachnospiraceae bacterium]|nr:HlyD family secretion protein [Lachnospiraceae bacterium]